MTQEINVEKFKNTILALAETLLKADEERREALVALSNEETQDTIEKIRAKVKELVSEGDFDGFSYHILDKYEDCILAILPEFSNHQTDDFLMNINFYERSFANLFIQFEGRACSSDKSRTVIRKIFDKLEHDKEIKFNYEQEYTFHLPQVVLKDEAGIMEAFEAFQGALYGKYDKVFQLFFKLGQPKE